MTLDKPLLLLSAEIMQIFQPKRIPVIRDSARLVARHSCSQVFMTPLTSICQCPDYRPWALLPRAQAAAGVGGGWGACCPAHGTRQSRRGSKGLEASSESWQKGMALQKLPQVEAAGPGPATSRLACLLLPAYSPLLLPQMAAFSPQMS